MVMKASFFEKQSKLTQVPSVIGKLQFLLFFDQHLDGNKYR